MYGMCGKLTAQAGKREEFMQILVRAAKVVAQIPGCQIYLVNADLADETGIWVYEVWETKEAHDASLHDEQVRALISEARPLMSDPPEGIELNVIGGHGIRFDPVGKGETLS